MARLPDFLIIGAARSGTTALWSALRKHPDFFMCPAKEPNFFAFEGESLGCRGPGADFINNSITEFDRYCALFAEAPGGSICGEASPLYLYAEKAPAAIFRHIPEVRLVAVLRNPIEQAHSHFLYAKRNMLEPLEDFAQALDREEERLQAGWQPLFGYSRFPRYHEQLSRFYATFRPDQIKVFLYEDFQSDPAGLINEACRFAGARSSFLPEVVRVNAGGRPKSAWLQNIIMKPNVLGRPLAAVLPLEVRRRIRDAIAERNLDRGEAIDPRARAILRERLHDEIVRLQDLLGRDLGAWLT